MGSSDGTGVESNAGRKGLKHGRHVETVVSSNNTEIILRLPVKLRELVD